MTDKMVRLEELRSKLLATATLIDIEEGNEDRRYEQGVRGLNETNDRVVFEDMEDAIANPGPLLVPSIGFIPAIDSHLFYPGMMHTVFGPPSAGKSLLMTRIVGDELVQGKTVMWLDAEVRSARHPLGQRMHAMGYPGEIGKNLRFALTNRAMSHDNRDMFATMIENEHIGLVVVDSLGEFIGMQGGDANKELDIVRAFSFFEPLARAGAAVVFVDHPSKSATWEAAGSARKGAHVDVSYAMNADLRRDDRPAHMERSFSRFKPGYSRLFCTKDRHGTYADYQCVTRMTVNPHNDGELLTVDFEVDNDDDLEDMIVDETRPELRNRQVVTEDDRMNKLLAYLSDGATITKRGAKEVCGFGNTRDADALIGKALTAGYIEVALKTDKTKTYRLRAEGHVTIQ